MVIFEPPRQSAPSASNEPPRGSQPDVDAPSAVILVADDDSLTRDILGAVLGDRGYRVESVSDGQAAIERVGQGGVDLVLLDILMPRLNGLEACRLLKSMSGDAFLPIVLVTVKTDTSSRVEGLRIGADDYVCKPFDEEELVARIEAMLRVKRLHDQVARARTKLEQLSMHDELTGLFNYRYLHHRMNEEFKRSERYHDPLACIVVDVDRLAVLNQAGGRTLGDQVLLAVAQALRRNVREVDVVARFGGDEFLIILPSTHFAGSATVAQRVWREIGTTQFRLVDGSLIGTTVSLGVALFPSRDVRTKDSLLRAANTALDQAKRDGGNRVCVYQQQGYLYTPLAGPPVLEVTVRQGGALVSSNALPVVLPSFRPEREEVATLRPLGHREPDLDSPGEGTNSALDPDWRTGARDREPT